MISKLSVLLMALTPTVSFADVESFVNKAVLVQEFDESGTIKGQSLDTLVLDTKTGSYISRSPSTSSFKLFGFCVNTDGSVCKRDLMSQAELASAFALSNGRRAMDASVMPPLQDFSISSVTTVLKDTGDVLTLKVDQSIFSGLGKNSTIMKISKVKKLSDIKHAFATPTEDKPNRKFINDVEEKLKTLALGVVQLNSRPDTENLLSSGSVGSGTGYFITSDGLMMTNHHVIDEHRDCMEKLACDIDFKQFCQMELAELSLQEQRC